MAECVTYKNCFGFNRADTINILHQSYVAIKQFEWIIDASITEFFVESQWQKLKKSWQEVLQYVDPTTLANFISYDKPLVGDRVWPLSMLALRKIANIFNISRKLYLLHPSMVSSTTLPASYENEFHQKSVQNMFYKKVKRKKKHEIDIMAKVCSEVAKHAGVFYIVDTGSGLGHLARLLAYCYNIKVCAIERNELLTYKARELDKSFRKKFVSNLKLYDIDPHDPIHVTYNIESDFNIEQFMRVVKPALGISKESNFTCGIVGLHPCGNLGPILLRLYTNCDDIRFICNVGCCYMKMTTSIENSTENNIGFPLSKFCNNHKYALSYYSRELACHAIENYCDRLMDPLEYDCLRVHCFRATLEDMIARKWPHVRNSYVNSVKKIEGISFYEYCMLAVNERLGISITEADCLEDSVVTRNLKNWPKVLAFHGIRTMFAPLIESVILLDRILYLLEHGCSTKVECLFDPKISPRAHILYSFK